MTVNKYFKGQNFRVFFIFKEMIALDPIAACNLNYRGVLTAQSFDNSKIHQIANPDVDTNINTRPNVFGV